jgi:hypothetical protein
METRTWEPKYDGHAPPHWRWGLEYWVLECKTPEPHSYLDGPAWWRGNSYLINAEGLYGEGNDEDAYDFHDIADCPLCKSPDIVLLENLGNTGKCSFECLGCGLQSGKKQYLFELKEYWNKR